jgi:hypothetical protein
MALMAGRVRARRQQLEARSWAARRDSTAEWPWSTGKGWERELIGGAHASTRGEREDAEDGRRESKKKTYSVEYAKGA